MSFLLDKDQSYSAIDPDTNSRVVISGSPQIELKRVKFSSPDISLDTALVIRPKFPDRPIIADDPSNPCVMISAGDLNRAFSARNMRDVECNITSYGHRSLPPYLVTADSSNNLYLTDGVSGDQIKLDSELGSNYYGVQQMQFADGTVWTRQQLNALAKMGTTGND
jgi:hypothetical protein